MQSYYPAMLKRNRRSFIKNSSLLALGIPFLKSQITAQADYLKLPAIGIQLYMVPGANAGFNAL
jgi:hypothetical protein